MLAKSDGAEAVSSVFVSPRLLQVSSRQCVWATLLSTLSASWTVSLWVEGDKACPTLEVSVISSGGSGDAARTARMGIQQGERGHLEKDSRDVLEGKPTGEQPRGREKKGLSRKTPCVSRGEHGKELFGVCRK